MKKHIAPQYRLPIAADSTPAPLTLGTQSTGSGAQANATQPALVAPEKLKPAKDLDEWIRRLAPEQRAKALHRKIIGRQCSPVTGQPYLP